MMIQLLPQAKLPLWLFWLLPLDTVEMSVANHEFKCVFGFQWAIYLHLSPDAINSHAFSICFKRFSAPQYLLDLENKHLIDCSLFKHPSASGLCSLLIFILPTLALIRHVLQKIDVFTVKGDL